MAWSAVAAGARATGEQTGSESDFVVAGLHVSAGIVVLACLDEQKSEFYFDDSEFAPCSKEAQSWLRSIRVESGSVFPTTS